MAELADAGTEEPTPLLAVDHGGARLGLAAWDPVRGLHEVGIIRHRSLAADVRRIAGIAAERNAGRVIVGLPLNADGSEGEQARRARRFAEALAADLTVPVVLVDERGTSEEAIAELDLVGRPLGERERAMVDARAARLLIERHLRGA